MRALALVALVILTAAAPAAAQTVLPEWARRADAEWSGERVPQVGERTRLFRRAREPHGPIDGGLLVCRVHADGRWDLFADPDLRVRYRIGRQRGDLWGTENSRTEVFSIPGVRLRRGGGLRFQIADRDVTVDERIATVRGRFDGGPIRLERGPAEVECRVVDAGLVARRRDRALRAAEPALVRLERARPDLTADDLGRPLAASSRPLVEAASWAGWDDVRVAEARRRHEDARARFERALARALREAHANAPAPGREVRGGRGRVRVGDVVCGPRAAAMIGGTESSAPECVVRVHATRGAALAGADMIGLDGRPIAVGAPVALDDDGGYALPVYQRIPARALLRVGRPRVLLRVR